MRQVPVVNSGLFSASSPQPIGIVGNGRLAKHITYYFQLLGVPYIQWQRSQGLPLEQVLQDCSTIWLLIKDSAIAEFAQMHQLFFKSRMLLHASGALTLPDVLSYHPLMTFSNELYDLDFYQAIPFIGVHNTPALSALIPQLPNPYFAIPVELKSRYHAHCVMSNNFTTLLWQNFFNFLESELKLPKQVAHPYLQRTLSNLTSEHYQQALTGPLPRQDVGTIKRNIKALAQPQEQQIYRDFVKLYDPQLGDSIHES